MELKGKIITFNNHGAVDPTDLIVFQDADFEGRRYLHHDALVISHDIADYDFKRNLSNGGAHPICYSSPAVEP